MHAVPPHPSLSKPQILWCLLPTPRSIFITSAVVQARSGATAVGWTGLWTISREGADNVKNIIVDDSCEGFCLAASESRVHGYACLSAQCSKCKTGKAFSIIGILCVTVALAGTLTSAVPKPAAMGSAFFGSFSYMLIFAIAAGNYNGEPSVDSDCGTGYSDNDNVSYGAAFALAIVNFFSPLPAS